MDLFDRELEAFAASDWGEATITPGDAAGLCKRATLALLARLEAAGLDDSVELWRLELAIGGKGRGADGHSNHWILVRRGEAIDVSARQFDPAAPHIRRGPTQDEFDRWRIRERIDPDGEDIWRGGLARHELIPPYWRDLLTVGPPGDLPDWPYPRHMLEPTSRWYAPANP